MLAHEREIFHRLLTYFHPENYEDFFSFFEEPERLELQKLSVYEEPLNLKIESSKEALNAIHYSWFVPILKRLPQPLLELTLGLFNPTERKKLFKLSGLKTSRSIGSPYLKDYLRIYLLNQMGYSAVAPRCFVPPSLNHKLLHFSKKRLVLLIEELGLVELAQVSKKIVDSKVLKRVHHFLSPAQQKRFATAQKYNEPRPLPSINFASVLQSDLTFKQIVEKRGIERLARGLVLEHPFFLWHLAHTLDQGRGHHLLIRCRRFLPNTYTPFYQKQLVEYTRQLEENTVL